MTEFCPDCGSFLDSKMIDGKPRAYCDECREVVWENPKPVGWILVEKDEEVLLVKRKEEPDKGEWDIPGGFLEVDESFEEAAIRELEEETGLKIDKSHINFLDTLAFERGEQHVVGVVFQAEIEEVECIEAGDDAAEAGFWTFESLEDSDNTIRAVCKDVLKKKN